MVLYGRLSKRGPPLQVSKLEGAVLRVDLDKVLQRSPDFDTYPYVLLHLNRDYFKAKVGTIWVHGLFGSLGCEVP